MEKQTKASPKLPRITFSETFQSSQPEKEQRFTLDKILARGIMQNKSSLIVETQPLSNINEEIIFDVNQAVQRSFLQLRSNYDKTKSATYSLQSRINHLNQEKKLLTEEQSKMANQNRQIQESYNYSKNRNNQLHNGVEEIVFQLDSYSNIQQRLKADNIYYKKHIFDCNLETKKLKNELRRITQSSQREKKTSLRCRNLLQSVEKTLHQNTQERNRGIQSLGENVTKRRQYAQKEKERARSFIVSMQQAQTRKLPFQKQLINVLRTHQFVKKLFHSRMEFLINKYADVNNAFTKIRQNTEVKTTQQLIKKYLKKDQIYGALLESISTLQPRIQTLKNEQKIIKNEHRILMNRKEELQDLIKHIQKKDMGKTFAQIDQFNKKLKNIDYFRNLLTNWGSTTISMFKGVKKGEVRKGYQYLKNLVQDCLKILQKYLQESSETQKSIAEKMLQKQTSKQDQKERLLGRNIRIKTLGAQRFNQQDEVQYDLRTEKQHIHVTRKAIKKHYINLHKMNIKT